MQLLERLDRIENQEIGKLRRSLSALYGTGLTNPQLQSLLVQRALVAREFGPLYDKALLGVKDDPLRAGLKWLMREEYPAREKDHRLALVEDLACVGVEKAALINARPTLDTRLVIDGLHTLLDAMEGEAPQAYDVRAAATLRSAMEVSVSAEYARLLPLMVDPARGWSLTEQNSQFYVPHRDHDRKTRGLHLPAKGGQGNHADVFTRSLQRLVTSDALFHEAASAMRCAYGAKARFYRQF